MTKYKLRKSTQDDLQLAFDIRKNALGEYVTQTWGWDEEWQMKYHIEDFDTAILSIIEVEGKPAGSLEKYEDGGCIRVSGIYITSEYQGRGIGCDIMKKIIREAGSKNMSVKFQVLKVNARAKKFYERLGFIVNGENETHYQMIYKLYKIIS